MRELVWFWAIAIPLGAVANLFAFQIFARLETLGYGRCWWRMEDFRLYKLYWKLAPQHGWSRMPLVAAGLCFVSAAAVVVFIALVAWRQIAISLIDESYPAGLTAKLLKNGFNSPIEAKSSKIVCQGDQSSKVRRAASVLTSSMEFCK